MSARNLLLRQESEDGSGILPSSPSLSSLNRLRDTFRRTESLSSQLSAMVTSAASAASGAVLGTSTAGAASEASSASTSEVSTPVRRKKPAYFKMSLCNRTKSPSSDSSRSSSFSEDCDESVKDVSYCPRSPKISISNHDRDEEIIRRPTCLHDIATVVQPVVESEFLNSEEPCTPSSVTASSTLILGRPLNKGRKRKKQPEKWKANLIKMKRNSGNEYETHTLSKKVRPASKIKTPCAETCKFKCFQNFSEEEGKQLFTLYWGLGDIEKQRQYIANCMTIVEPRYRYVRIGGTKGPRQPNNTFHFKKGDNDVRVCKLFFMNILDINDRPIMTVLKKREKFANQILEPDQRGKHGKHKKLNPNLKAGVKQFIDNIPKIESHYTRKNLRYHTILCNLISFR